MGTPFTFALRVGNSRATRLLSELAFLQEDDAVIGDQRYLLSVLPVRDDMKSDVKLTNQIAWETYARADLRSSISDSIWGYEDLAPQTLSENVGQANFQLLFNQLFYAINLLPA